MFIISVLSLVIAISLLIFVQNASVILACSFLFISFFSALKNLKVLSDNDNNLKNKEFKITSNKSISFCSVILIINIFIVSSLILIFILQSIL